MSKRTTTTVSASDARQRLSELVKDVFRSGNRVIIEKGEIPVAVIVPLVDLYRLEYLDRQQEALVKAAGHPRDISDDQLMAEVATVIAEVRAEDEAAVAQRRP